MPIKTSFSIIIAIISITVHVGPKHASLLLHIHFCPACPTPNSVPQYLSNPPPYPTTISSVGLPLSLFPPIFPLFILLSSVPYFLCSMCPNYLSLELQSYLLYVDHCTNLIATCYSLPTSIIVRLNLGERVEIDCEITVLIQNKYG